MTKIGNTNVDRRQPAIMGIVNLTPDSFSDGGQFTNPDHALHHIEQLISDGADIIDIGAESSRPGAEPISAETEIERLAPILNVYKKHFSTPLSLDTYKASVAQFGLDYGVDMINDISGLTHDPLMADIVASYQVPVVIMHMQGSPTTMQQNPRYTDLITDIRTALDHQIRYATQHGITDIIIDPGIGFGKTPEHNMMILQQLDQFTSLGCPILIGTSRKSFLGHITGRPAHDRLPETIASTLTGISNGAAIVRVHDVGAISRALKTHIACTTPVIG